MFDRTADGGEERVGVGYLEPLAKMVWKCGGLFPRRATMPDLRTCLKSRFLSSQ